MIVGPSLSRLGHASKGLPIEHAHYSNKYKMMVDM